MGQVILLKKNIFNKMKTLLIVIFIFSSYSYNYAQDLDTLPNYFPGIKGSRYLYLQDSDSYTLNSSSSSIYEKGFYRDTIMNGNYYIVDYSSWLRFDIKKQRIYSFIIYYNVPKDTLFMDFSLQNGQTFYIPSPFAPGFNPATVVSTKYVFFGDTLKAKGFHTINMEMGYNRVYYAKNIGEVFSYSYDGAWGHSYTSRSLIEAEIHTRDSIIKYDDKNAPEILFNPPSELNGDSLKLRVQVKHVYSILYEDKWVNSPRHFIDSVTIYSHYKKDSTIQLEQMRVAFLENSHGDFYTCSLKIYNQMLADGWEFCYKIVAKDKGIFPEYTTVPPEGYFTFGTPPLKTENDASLKIFCLSQNYPNPFNPVTKIQFTVPHNEAVKIKVYDFLGAEITTLVNRELNSGSYEVDFNGKTLASGIYFVRMEAGKFVETKKIVLLK